MTALYGRYYELTLYSATGSQTLSIKAPVQIQFRVTYYAGSGAIKGTAEITIYGLNLASMDQIINKYDRIKLVAGYVGGSEAIFDGAIFTPSKGKAGMEQYLALYCTIMGKDESQATINNTWGNGTRVCDIVKEIASNLGVPVTFLPAIDAPDSTFWSDLGRVRTLSLSTKAYTALDDLGRSYGFVVYRLLDKVLILPRTAVGSGTSHVISADTGMEGSPLFSAGPTVNVVTRLNPKIMPGDEILVKTRYSLVVPDISSNFNDQTRFTQAKSGRYFASSIIHYGDFYSDTWSTSIQGYALGVDHDPITTGDYLY
ncbi:hypothetical protein [Pseudomonas sp. dw_358]|uniref:hypothetical protein n=1 Tax=Pseudomonas sp. dw_358 TaxID=2720083 RepID=UPI001BD64F37|nr:hypothetical protein [Pseudomonas sp. dw_358]